MTTTSRFLRALGAENLLPFSDELRTSGEGVFQPTATTSFLLKEAKRRIAPGMRVLDLGCGWGIIGLELALDPNREVSVCLSDQSREAVEAAKYNASILHLGEIAVNGSLFEPWVDEVFDLIVCDVSGISDQIPMLDTWFEGVPCETGADGLALVKVIIENAKSHLRDSNSSVLIPLISLSDTAAGLRLMRANFSRVTLLSENQWSLRIPKVDDQVEMESLKEKNLVSFTSNGESFQFTTQIYELRP
ncbi:MAG TPA: methyltransferase [Candidatus Paceibacterota bacterium]|nr:methyltransferase [Candidatus Paceibacterota bacterium]